MKHKQFSFHIMNTHFRERCASTSKSFVRHQSGSYDQDRIARYLNSCSPKDLQKHLMSFSSSLPNTPQFFEAQRRNLMSMTLEHGQPCIFGTHSFADTRNPALHHLIVRWARLQDTVRDPFAPNITPQEARSRKVQNLVDYPCIVSSFWQKLTLQFRDSVLFNELGFNHFFERTEYQSRGSAHGHWLAWHPHTPPDGFLDELEATANAIVASETNAKEFDANEAADLATDLSSWSPAVVDYDTSSGLPVVPEGEPVSFDGSHLPVFTRGFLQRYEKARLLPQGEGHRLPSILHLRTAVSRAAIAARWYDRICDATSDYFDAESDSVCEEFLKSCGEVHPSEKSHVRHLCESSLHWEFPVHVTASATAAQVFERDYQHLRERTCRHTECNPAYCIRTDPKSKKQYCRFAKSLAIRQLSAPIPKRPKHLERLARTHYVAESAKAKDGTDLLHWQLYIGNRLDPRLNTCMSTHMRVFRSNVDGKPCFNKFGVAQYVQFLCLLTLLSPLHCLPSALPLIVKGTFASKRTIFQSQRSHRRHTKLLVRTSTRTLEMDSKRHFERPCSTSVSVTIVPKRLLQ